MIAKCFPFKLTWIDSVVRENNLASHKTINYILYGVQYRQVINLKLHFCGSGRVQGQAPQIYKTNLDFAAMTSLRFEQNVQFILLAEFDIDQGSVLSHQYPFPTGTDEQCGFTDAIREPMCH